MSDNKYPDISIFPDLNVVIRTPAGNEYRGKALEHKSQHADGEVWYQVRLNGVGKETLHASALLAQEFRKNGRPDYFAAESNVEPLALNLNRIPVAKRTDKNADTLVGDFWDAAGLWTVLAKPSKSAGVLIAGSLLPSPSEINNNPGSKIAEFRRPTPPGEAPAEKVAPAPKAGRAAKAAPK